jgi:hypothetical protein
VYFRLDSKFLIGRREVVAAFVLLLMFADFL